MSSRTLETNQAKVEDKLRKMLGRTYLYNTMTVKILSWKHEGEYTTVVTSGPWKSLPTHEMLKFLENEFLEAEEDDSINSNTPTTTSLEAIPMPDVKGLDRMGDLVDMLFTNIDKVTTQKDFVDQAKAVSMLTNNVVGVVKTQLEALRLATDIHRNR